MLQEEEPVGLERNHILPNIYVPCGTSCRTPKETSAPLGNEYLLKKHAEPKVLKKEEIEVVPDIQMHEQAINSQRHLVITSNNAFTKSADVPHVLQACQNFDLRFPRELLKNALTLNLNSDGCLNETISDEANAFRLAYAKYIKSYQQYQQQKPHETEEQAAARRARNALRMRNYRQNIQVLETAEQAAERRAQNALRMRNYRRFKREIEPDLAAERRAQNAERMRNYRKIIREVKPETAALLRAQNASRMRNYRKNKLQKEPE